MAMTEVQKGKPNHATTFPARKSKGEGGRNTAFEAGAAWQKLQPQSMKETEAVAETQLLQGCGEKYPGVFPLPALGLPSVSPVGQTYQEVRKQRSREMQFPLRQSRVEKAGMDLETNWCM